MRIFVSGATGFIGRALCLRLRRDGHEVVAWSRDPARAGSVLGPEVEARGGDDSELTDALKGCDAVVNLAGAPVLPGRWTPSKREAIRESRVGGTARIVAAMGKLEPAPRVFVSASAVGFYGGRQDELLTESSAPGEGFLAEVCRDWEGAALAARDHGVRVAVFRIGLVLGLDGGVLGSLLPVFRLGLGGRIGSGDQWAPWVHLDDVLEAFVLALEDDSVRGPLNLTAPVPETNRSFTRALGVALGRPTALPVPAIALRALLGEAATALLQGQRAVPVALQSLGFRFRYRGLSEALAAVLDQDRTTAIRRVDPAEVPSSTYLRERKPRYLLTQTTVIDEPLDRVLPFFSDAGNLSALTPSSMGFDIQTPQPIEMRPGTRIDYRIALGPVPMNWRTEIAVWEPGRRFVDAQLRGPYRCWWHEHRFREEGGRTVMEDRVFYAPPLGPLGRLANALFIRSMLLDVFGFRAHAMARRFGASATAESPRLRVVGGKVSA